MNRSDIIIKPIVTEKTMDDVSAGKYTFVVAKDATKTHIKQAIKDVFHVSATAVTTSIVKGKRKKVGKRREEVNQTSWKKAVVTLKKGDKISLFEPGPEEKKK